MFALFLAVAFAADPAHPPEDVAAKKAADAALGKDIPWAAFCFAEVKVGEAAAVRLVGIRKRETGCEPAGVLVAGAWVPVEAALPAVLGADVWKALPTTKKDEVARAWVDGALLGFAHPSGSATVAHAGGRTQVSRTYLRRDGEAGRAADAKTTFDFDASGVLVGKAETVTRTWQTTLFVQRIAVSGIAEDVAQVGTESSGAAIRSCWQDVWEFDRTVSGNTRLEWTVSGGKASKVTIVDPPTMPESVVTCIGNALQRTSWPPEAAGTVRYLFSLDRR
jgi:hypothetical protein